MASHELTIPAGHGGRRLDQVLAELLPDYSRSRIKQWIVEGHVLLDGVKPEPRTRVAAGQHVAVTAAASVSREVVAQAVDFRILYEDESLLVVDKPAGLVVHPGAGNPDRTLENGLRRHLPGLAALPRSGLLHRLDKDTSGLVLVAKTLPALTHLTRALQERRITREYRALVNGCMTAGGTVDEPIGRHPVHRTRMAVHVGGRPAVTHYRVLERLPAHTYVAVRLETGRTHQIRVHLAHIGFPIVGDPDYGGRPRLPPGASPEVIATLRAFRRQALHAWGLRFQHPASGDPLEFSAPLPEDFRTIIQALAGTDAARLEKLSWPKPQNPQKPQGST
jgi:23S rRNA pseudouridine1911/1915/1917 synthase